MALKRARFDDFITSGYDSQPVDTQEGPAHEGASGKVLFDYLVGQYASGQMNAVQVCTVSYLHGQAGGQGCESLACEPESAKSNAARLLKFALAKGDENEDLLEVTTPIFDKRNARRESFQMPVRLPTSILKKACQTIVEPAGPDPLIDGTLSCPAFLDHPVRKAYMNKLHWSRIRPTSIFFDGVSYTKNDQFYGLYIRDLRTGEEEVVFLVRSLALCLRVLLFRTSLQTDLHPTLAIFLTCSIIIHIKMKGRF